MLRYTSHNLKDLHVPTILTAKPTTNLRQTWFSAGTSHQQRFGNPSRRAGGSGTQAPVLLERAWIISLYCWWPKMYTKDSLILLMVQYLTQFCGLQYLKPYPFGSWGAWLFTLRSRCFNIKPWEIILKAHDSTSGYSHCSQCQKGLSECWNNCYSIPLDVDNLSTNVRRVGSSSFSHHIVNIKQLNAQCSNELQNDPSTDTI